MHCALPIGFVTDVRGLVGEPAKAELAACKSLAKRKPARSPFFSPGCNLEKCKGWGVVLCLRRLRRLGLPRNSQTRSNAAPEDARGASRTLLAFKLIRRIGRAAWPAVSRPTKGAKSINRHPNT